MSGMRRPSTACFVCRSRLTKGEDGACTVPSAPRRRSAAKGKCPSIIGAKAVRAGPSAIRPRSRSTASSDRAAAALSLDEVFRRRGLVPEDGARIAFAPAMLGHFPFAAERQRGGRGTVQAASPRIVRRLRRAKQMVLGRRMPLFVRRCLYLAGRLRRSAP